MVPVGTGTGALASGWAGRCIPGSAAETPGCGSGGGWPRDAMGLWEVHREEPWEFVSK